MSLPDSHLETLERHLQRHDERLASLHASREAFGREIERRESDEEGRELAKTGGVSVLSTQRDEIEREIAAHERLVGLGRDRRVLDALAEIAADPELAREAARDPKGFAREHGIEIPERIALELTVDGDQISLRITHYDELSPFIVTWDASGFSEPREEPAGAA